MKRIFNICEFSTFNVRNKNDDLSLTNPVKVYINCDSLEVKKIIYKDNIRMSGIYLTPKGYG